MRVDSTPPGLRDFAAIWQATRDRITDLVSERGASCADTPVMTVPGATVMDVLLHLIGNAKNHEDGGDVATSTLPLPSPQPNRTMTPQALIDRWNDAAASMGHIKTDDTVLPMLITDAVMCEHDLRTAMTAPGARDDVAVKVALDELSARFSDRVAAAGLPSLRVTVEQWGTIIGDGLARSCVVADRFEFVRAMSGRRSAAEIKRWNWSDDPVPYLAVIAENELPTNDIREPDPRVSEHMRDREFVL